MASATSPGARVGRRDGDLATEWLAGLAVRGHRHGAEQLGDRRHRRLQRVGFVRTWCGRTRPRSRPVDRRSKSGAAVSGHANFVLWRNRGNFSLRRNRGRIGRSVLGEPRPNERWLLVTSALHMPRAVGAFRRAGFPVEPYPVDWITAGPKDTRRFSSTASGGLTTTDIGVHEWIGLVVYWLGGQTSELFPSP